MTQYLRYFKGSGHSFNPYSSPSNTVLLSAPLAPEEPETQTLLSGLAEATEPAGWFALAEQPGFTVCLS